MDRFKKKVVLESLNIGINLIKTRKWFLLK